MNEQIGIGTQGHEDTLAQRKTKDIFAFYIRVIKKTGTEYLNA